MWRSPQRRSHNRCLAYTRSAVADRTREAAHPTTETPSRAADTRAIQQACGKRFEVDHDDNCLHGVGERQVQLSDYGTRRVTRMSDSREDDTAQRRPPDRAVAVDPARSPRQLRSKTNSSMTNPSTSPPCEGNSTESVTQPSWSGSLMRNGINACCAGSTVTADGVARGARTRMEYEVPALPSVRT